MIEVDTKHPIHAGAYQKDFFFRQKASSLPTGRQAKPFSVGEGLKVLSFG